MKRRPTCARCGRRLGLSLTFVRSTVTGLAYCSPRHWKSCEETARENERVRDEELVGL